MATAPVTDVDELNRLLRTLREGSEGAIQSIDDLFGLDQTQKARAALKFGDSAKGEAVRGLTQATAEVLGHVPFMDKGGSLATQRFAMSALNNPILRTGLKYAPVVGTGLAAGDVIFGDESFGNKAMDTALMGAGGLIGSAVPVVGTGLGITGGKLLSDLTQYLLGGGE